MKLKISLLLFAVSTGLIVIAQTKSVTQVQREFQVTELGVVPWSISNGIPYMEGEVISRGAASFRVMDSERVIFLCNSSNEIIEYNMISGKVISRFNVDRSPINFLYEDSKYFVLYRHKLIIYQSGIPQKEVVFPKLNWDARYLFRKNNSTYILSVDGRCIKVECSGNPCQEAQLTGFLTKDNEIITTKNLDRFGFAIEVTDRSNKSYSKVYNTADYISGAFVVGQDAKYLYLILEQYTIEPPKPDDWFRKIIAVPFVGSSLGEIALSSTIPNCDYVESKMNFYCTDSGKVFQMLTSPKGTHILVLTPDGQPSGYPEHLAKLKCD